MFINNYLSQLKENWTYTSTCFPENLLEIPEDIKQDNSKKISEFIENIEKSINSFSNNFLFRKKQARFFQKLFIDFFETEKIFNIKQSLRASMLTKYQLEIISFLKNARLFAPELEFNEIGQAIRNYLVYVMFKELNNSDQPFSMACFGYSMLYPFTDNYIDCPDFSLENKKKYNNMIEDKILGREVFPDCDYYKKTCALLQKIEDNYPRNNNSLLYELILSILDAQKTSICQQDNETSLSYEEILDISLYKGGVSVLIDRIFIDMNLTDADFTFYLGMGFFLQIADDLQDINSDYLSGNQTLFTLSNSFSEREIVVNKAINFILQLLNDIHVSNNNFKEFVKFNCLQLIYVSIFRSSDYFSKSYLDNIEKLLLVSRSDLDRLGKNKLLFTNNKSSKKTIKIIDYIIAINKQ